MSEPTYRVMSRRGTAGIQLTGRTLEQVIAMLRQAPAPTKINIVFPDGVESIAEKELDS